MALLPKAWTISRIDVAARRATTGEIVVALGLPTLIFLCGALAQGAPPLRLTNAGVVGLLLMELMLAGVLLPFLSQRGWSARPLLALPEPIDILRGGAVWLMAMAAGYALYVAYYLAAPAAARALQAPLYAGSISFAGMLTVSLVNPFFEEFLWLGYGIPALGSRYGLRKACAISVLLRTSIHLYQGTSALLFIVPLAVVFTFYFVRTGRLWPVIVAHVISDAVGLAMYVVHSG